MGIEYHWQILGEREKKRERERKRVFDTMY